MKRASSEQDGHGSNAGASAASSATGTNTDSHRHGKHRKRSHDQGNQSSREREYFPDHSPFILEDLDDHTQQQLRELVFDMIFHQSNDNQKRNLSRRFLGDNPTLPGPLAITLSRRSIQTCLLAEEYWVCEKSDGERRMLLFLQKSPKNVVCQRGVYLIDRGFTIQRLADSEVYPAHCCKNGNTLLDGELLVKDNQARSLELRVALRLSNNAFYPEFLMFDAITYDGEHVGNKTLEQRLTLIGTIRQTMRQKQPLPMRILGKHMVPLKYVDTIFGSIQKLGMEYGEETLCGNVMERRQYQDKARWNDTDGLVFTPGRVSYTDLIVNPKAKEKTPLLKWKWKEHNTVDFQVLQEDLERKDHLIPLSVSTGGGNSVAVSMAKLDERTKQKLLQAFVELERSILIVECSYNPQNSTWNMVRIRDRRNSPNFVRVAFHTLEVLMEDITLEEIAKSVGRRNKAGGVK